MSEITLREPLFETLVRETRAIDTSGSEHQLLARLSFFLLAPVHEVAGVDDIYRLATRKNSLGMSVLQCVAVVDQVMKTKWLPADSGSRLLIRTQELELSPQWRDGGFDGADKLNVDFDIERAVQTATGITVRLPEYFWWEHPIIQSAQALYMCNPSYSLQAHLDRVKRSLHVRSSLDAITQWTAILFGLPHDQCRGDKHVARVMSESLVQQEREHYINRRVHALAEVCSLCLGLPVKKIRLSIMRAIDNDDTFRIWTDELLSQLLPA